MAGKTNSSPMPWAREKRDGRQSDYRERVQGLCSLMPLTRHCSLVHLLSHAQLSATPWTAAWLFSLSFTVSCSLLSLISIESMMPSNHLILCRPLLLPSVFPSIRIFTSESALHIRWPKYWSFMFSISPSNEYSGLISCTID